MYALCLLVLIYDWAFVRNLFRGSTKAAMTEDFYFEYFPIQSAFTPKMNKSKEALLVTLATAALFVSLAGMRILGPYFNLLLQLPEKEQ